MGGVSAFGDQPAHRHLLSDHLRRDQLLWARRCRHSCAHAQQVAWSIAGSRLRNTSSTPRRLIHLPAVPDWSDFDDRQRKTGISLKSTVSVRAHRIGPNNRQTRSTSQDARPRYTGELLERTRPNIYRQMVRLLSDGVSANQICKLCHVTRETVRAVERREAAEISARKKSIIGILSNVAELGASRMEETIGKAGLRDAAIGTGVAVDKMLALAGQTPLVQISEYLDADGAGARGTSRIAR